MEENIGDGVPYLCVGDDAVFVHFLEEVAGVDVGVVVLEVLVGHAGFFVEESGYADGGAEGHC